MEGLLQWEGTFLLWIQEAVRSPVLDLIVCLYTRLGNGGMLWIALCLLMLCFPKTRRAGIAGGLGLVFSLLFTNILLKPLVDRTRPWLVIDGLLPLVVENDPKSFPSGHTSAAFACAAAWFFTLPRRWMGVLGMAVAAVMGLSRLYVGVHFPTDVLCGALVGIFSGILSYQIIKIFGERRRTT